MLFLYFSSSSADFYYWREYLCFLLNSLGVRPLGLHGQGSRRSFLLYATPTHPQLLLRPRTLRAPVNWPDYSAWIGLQSQWAALFKAQHACVWLPVDILSSPQSFSESLPLPMARCTFQQRFREDSLGKHHPGSGRSIPCSPLSFSLGSSLYGKTGLSTSRVVFSEMWLGFESITQACFGPTVLSAAWLQYRVLWGHLTQLVGALQGSRRPQPS